jgi:hypothetical protein
MVMMTKVRGVSNAKDQARPGLCGHASCRSARGSVTASARSLACGRRSFAQPSGSLAVPRSEDRWRPACRPIATARSRRVIFHPYKGTERRRTVAVGSGEKSRCPLEGEAPLQACLRAPIRFRRGPLCRSRKARSDAPGRRGARRLLPHRRRPAVPRLPAAHATGPHGARGPRRQDPDQLTRRGDGVQGRPRPRRRRSPRRAP